MVFSFSGSYQKGRNEFEYFEFGTTIRVKASGNVMFSIAPNYADYRSDLQWVGVTRDPLMTATYGRRYLFSSIERKTFSAELRLNWTFSPKLSLQLYLQPYIDVAAFSKFKELAEPGTFDFNHYGGENAPVTPGDGYYIIDPDGTGPADPFFLTNHDFNYASLRGTFVFRWEFRPRSTLYFVWTQSREDITTDRDFRFGRDFRRLFDVEGYNIFMMKFTYRFQL